MNPVVTAGVYSWAFTAAREVLDFYADFAPTKPDPLCMDLGIHSAPGTPPGIALVVCWSGDPAEAEKALQPLSAIAKKARGSVGSIPYVSLQSMFDSSFPDGRKYFQKSGLVRSLDRAAIDTLLDVFGTPRPHALVVQLQGLGGAANRVKHGDTAFPHRDALCDMAFVTEWDDPSQSEVNMASMRDIWARLEPFTAGFYVNSRFENSERAFRENYGDNYARLVQLKNRYDPMNLFRLNANIAPAAHSA
jgi:hypothetical protein